MLKMRECVKLKNYESKIKFMIYADFERILKYCTDFMKKKNILRKN